MDLWRTTEHWGNLYIENIIIEADYPCLLLCKTVDGEWVIGSICDTEDISYLCIRVSAKLLCDFLDGKHTFMSIIEQAPEGILYVDEYGAEVFYDSPSEMPNDYLPDAAYCFELDAADSFFPVFKKLQLHLTDSV